MRTTRTYVLLEVPKGMFDFVLDRMKEAGYEHAIIDKGGEVHIDMHGIALAPQPDDETSSS